MELRLLLRPQHVAAALVRKVVVSDCTFGKSDGGASGSIGGGTGIPIRAQVTVSSCTIINV